MALPAGSTRNLMRATLSIFGQIQICYILQQLQVPAGSTLNRLQVRERKQSDKTRRCNVRFHLWCRWNHPEDLK